MDFPRIIIEKKEENFESESLSRRFCRTSEKTSEKTLLGRKGDGGSSGDGKLQGDGGSSGAQALQGDRKRGEGDGGSRSVAKAAAAAVDKVEKSEDHRGMGNNSRGMGKNMGNNKESSLKEHEHKHHKSRENEHKEHHNASVRVHGSPPCHRACPAGIDVKGYVTLISEGRFAEAEEVIRRDNPMGGVCGWICSRPCERECTRNVEFGAPVSIRALQRFVCQFFADSGVERKITTNSSLEHGIQGELTDVVQGGNSVNRKRVAVVGAGPAGLSAARDLALNGCDVTLYDERERAGGLLTLEMPSFRLPKEVVEQDVESVLACGVKLELGQHIGAKDFDALKQNYDAVLLSTGAASGLKGGLPGGEGISGIVDAVSLLKSWAEQGVLPSVRTALVVGSGSLAITAARVLAREKTANVFLVFPQSMELSAADPHEIKSAQEEGVRFLAGMMPERVVDQGGRFAGMLCRRIEDPKTCVAPLGRVDFKSTGDVEDVFNGELLVWGLDRESGWTSETLPSDMELGPLGTVKADSLTMRLGKSGRNEGHVFGAGEVITGPRGVVEAVASGRRAAKSIIGHFRQLDNDNKEGSKTLPASSSMIEPLMEPMTGHPWEVNKRHTRVYDPRRGFRFVANGESGGRVGDVVDPRPLPDDPSVDTDRATLEFQAQAAARMCLRCGPCMYCSSCSVHCPDGFVTMHGDHQLVRVERQVAISPEDLDGRLLLARVDPNLCRGCGSCERICPYYAPRVRLGPKRNVSVIDADYCRGCGKCVAVCPTGAINYPLSPAHLIEIDKGEEYEEE